MTIDNDLIGDEIRFVEYFGHQVAIRKTKRRYYKYMFRIKFNGENNWRSYLGTPNKCETIESALKRSWYRCKWKSEGVYEEHYRNEQDNDASLGADE